jgi:magnesium chelatase subunit I
LCGRTAISDRDILLAAQLALPHRIKKGPFDSADFEFDELQNYMQQARSDVQGAASADSRLDEMSNQEAVKKKMT